MFGHHSKTYYKYLASYGALLLTAIIALVFVSQVFFIRSCGRIWRTTTARSCSRACRRWTATSSRFTTSSTRFRQSIRISFPII